MAAGYIYVLANSSLPGLVNVGMSTTPPPEGTNKFSAETGLVTPFRVVFEDHFDDGRAAEAVIHSTLASRNLRVPNTKQFFRASVSEVLNTIASVSPPLRRKSPGSNADDNFLDVETDELGGYSLEGDHIRKDTRTALNYYKNGAKRGYNVCYAEMAKLFIDHRHTENARRSLFRFVDSSKDNSYFRSARDITSGRTNKPNQRPHFANEVLWALLKWDLSSSEADRKLIAPILEYTKELITDAEHKVDSYHVRTLAGMGPKNN
jgi:T5orf172 domain